MWCVTPLGVAAGVRRAPTEGEYYWRDLVGLQVVNESGVDLGKVVRLFSTPAHDVMAVAHGSGERLIPFVREVVIAVEAAGGRVVVDWDQDWV